MSLFMRRQKLRWLLVGSFALMPAVTTAQSGLVVLPTPCRLVDTRGVGAGTGILEPDSRRGFELSERGLDKQGGDTECDGLPQEGVLTNWAVNITVTGFSANGALKVWGGDELEPSASVINYSAGHLPSVANGVILRGCVNPTATRCDRGDIVVKALGNPTHLIIDVIGYFPGN